MTKACACGEPQLEDRVNQVLDEDDDRLDQICTEMQQKPWLKVISSDSGKLMPGDFNREFAELFTDHETGEMETKDFMVRALGLREYLSGKVKFTLQVEDFQTFQSWVTHLSFLLLMNRGLRYTVSLLPHPSFLLFQLEIKYLTAEDQAYALQAILETQQAQPL